MALLSKKRRARTACDAFEALDLPPAAQALYQHLAGTFYGDSEGDVLRFALVNWLHDHIATVNAVLNDPHSKDEP